MSGDAFRDGWMLAEAGEARIEKPAPRVAVIVALGVERACLRCAGPGIVVTQCGPGAARAADAASRALGAGARALVSFGLAGGVAADAAPGRLLLPRRIVTASAESFEIEPGWHRRLAAALAAELDVDDRPLLAADGVLATPGEKRSAATLGAAGVDLESGGIAAAAARASVPFAAIRAVADGPDDRLPPGVSGWVREDGETRLASVVEAALNPGNWAPLWTLGRRYAAARRTLERAARLLAHRDFLLA